MALRRTLTALFMLALFASPALAAVWPQAGEVAVTRAFAGADEAIPVGEPCHVTWTLRPTNGLPLGGLFVSEQYPTWLSVSNVSARVGSESVQHSYQAGAVGEIQAGLRPHRFVFGDPEGSPDLVVPAGMTLTLEFDLVAQSPGQASTDPNGWFGRSTGASGHALGGYLEGGPELSFGQTPLTLASFTVVDAGDHLALRWQLNLQGETETFRLQRGENANPIASVPLSGQVLEGPGDYRYDDYGAVAGRDYWYWLAMLDENGEIGRYLGPAQGRLTGVTPSAAAPLAAFPNPFNPKTTLRFALAEPARVELAIYDARGRLLRRLATGQLPAGQHSLDWDGRDEAGHALASGTYLARLLTGGRPAEERKLTLIR
jgi:hypothetical protein